MVLSRLSVLVLLLLYGFFLTGCAEKKDLANIRVTKVAEFNDRLGQANVKLYVYSGDVKLKNIKAYTEKIGCRMLYAYFYPDSVSPDEIPADEINNAKSYAEVQDILYEAEGVARWRFASQCLAVIPFVTDCGESPVSQNCR